MIEKRHLFMKDFVGIDECIIICKTEIEELGQGTCPFCIQ